MDAPPLSAHDDGLAESVRAWFRDDASRMTMMAARKFAIPERAVLDALVGDWPIRRLRDDAFPAIMEALTGFGPMRIFVRSRAAILEVVGAFGGYSESGPFFNVQTDAIDMHILPAEVAAIYAVEKRGHDTDYVTHSIQFFDRGGDAAFKAFLWEDYPNVPPARVAAFQDLVRSLAADPVDGEA